MKLETKIKQLTARLSPSALFNVKAYEMLYDGEGWSVNTPFRIASGVTRDELPAILRDRWEVIAANYGRKSVSDLVDVSRDHGYRGATVMLESDYFPIACIWPAR